MSSALDEDTQQTLAAGRETAGAMLRAAQKDLQKVFIFFLVGFLGTFYALRWFVWDFLKSVTEAQMSAHIEGNYDIIAQTPFDVILLQAKIGLVTGLILAAPAFVYFSRDALRERGAWPQSPVATWKLAFIVVTSAVLFVAGVAYGYFVFFPFMFAFLAGNALSAGFAPTYSIVMWAQFIFLLTVSFGLAAQMPLAITGLSYAEIVPYETFRDKWRYAVVAIFVFGALFSPPDPFTQIMWALPLLFLYGGSLYLAKVVVTARRGSERISVPAVARRRWNLLAGSAVLGGLAVYLFYERGGRVAFNGLLARLGSDYRIPAPGATLGLSPEASLAVWAAVGAAALALAALAYVVYAAIAESVDPIESGLGDPGQIDVASLDAAGVRAAPPEAFDDMTEEEAMAIAGQAVDEDDHEKAQAVLDRFDEAEERRESEADGDAPDVPEDAGTVGDRATRAGGTFLDEFTEGEKDEDDIGGYYSDIAFIVDSITSKTFRIVAVFMLVLGGTFAWLYTGGIKTVYDNFLSSLPASVTPDEVINVVALHPVEALIFEVKFSTLIAALVTLPIVAYYAWPAFRERNIVRQRRATVFLWTGALTTGLLGGFVLGYTFIAPAVISWLVNDAVMANMVIAYRITNFFWLIFFTTAGIGILADVPVAMVLLNSTGVSYQTMRNRWREVTVGVLAFAAVFTPAGIMTMFLVTVPLMVVYGIGLGVLFVVTLGGRRNLAPARGADV